MQSKVKRQHVAIGPPVPLVSYPSFTKFRMTEKQLKDMWDIIGPTVERNMTGNVPLWHTFTMCYVQGLENGSSLAYQDAFGEVT